MGLNMGPNMGPIMGPKLPLPWDPAERGVWPPREVCTPGAHRGSFTRHPAVRRVRSPHLEDGVLLLPDPRLLGLSDRAFGLIVGRREGEVEDEPAFSDHECCGEDDD